MKLFEVKKYFDIKPTRGKTVDLKGMEAQEYLTKKYGKKGAIKSALVNMFAIIGVFATILHLSVFFTTADASDNGRYKNATLENILDDKIIRFCKSNELSYEEAHSYQGNKFLNRQRCSLIGQAQIRMETKSCSKGLGQSMNNCFGLKGKNNKFIRFEDKTKSIEHWVARYYRLDYKKTIHTIVYGYWIDGGRKFGFTVTDKPHYYSYVKKFFRENYHNLYGQD